MQKKEGKTKKKIFLFFSLLFPSLSKPFTLMFKAVIANVDGDEKEEEDLKEMVNILILKYIWKHFCLKF